MARVLVIGAAGLLGGEVVRAVRAAGDEPVPTSRSLLQGWLRFDAGRDDPEGLLRAAQPKLVVNCAAVLASEIGEQSAEAVNTDFPHALAAAAATAGARVVHISTDGVFAADAARCFEDDSSFDGGDYGRTKRLGEPTSENAITLRSSFVGLDPTRRRGLLEWLRAQPAGTVVEGYVDHAWNGLASNQLAAVCAALADEQLFARARSESRLHHLFEDPPLSKYELLRDCVRVFELNVTVEPSKSGTPVTRVLGTRYETIVECLQSFPPRAESLELLATRGS